MIHESGSIVLFREIQQFRQFWAWILILIIPISCVIAIVDMFILDEYTDASSGANIATLVFMAIFGIGIPWLMYSARLATEVRNDGIYVRFSPFHRSFRKVSENMVRYEVRQYNAIGEYGGWGIRGGKKNGAYNVSGNMGLQLEFSNGNKLLIGTRKPDELIAAIRSVHK